MTTKHTIKVRRELREALYEIAGELQIKLGRRISLNDTIEYLIKYYREREGFTKKPELLLSLFASLRGEDLIGELRRGRLEDEEKSERLTRA